MAEGNDQYDHLLKLLLVGDAGVGKSSLLLRFTDDKFDDEQASTIGVDFKLKVVDASGKRVKLTIWDTAGQERFRTLTSSYYRGAHGIILVYDVARRATFDNIAQWLKEVDMYTTTDNYVTLLIGNKIDRDEREVSREEGLQFAREHAMVFMECSAKARLYVQQAFDELVTKILETPSLASETHSGDTVRVGGGGDGQEGYGSCCGM